MQLEPQELKTPFPTKEAEQDYCEWLNEQEIICRIQ